MARIFENRESSIDLLSEKDDESYGMQHKSSPLSFQRSLLRSFLQGLVGFYQL